MAAACGGKSEIFLEHTGELGKQRRAREAVARAICATCPDVDGCLSQALRDDEPAGVWGGMNPEERREFRRRTRV